MPGVFARSIIFGSFIRKIKHVEFSTRLIIRCQDTSTNPSVIQVVMQDYLPSSSIKVHPISQDELCAGCVAEAEGSLRCQNL